MFVDITKIHVKAGNGGNGCHSFYRDRAIQRGKPNGGDGGNGGDVVIQTDSSIHTLLDFQYRKNFKGRPGTHGSSNFKRGKDGEDCIVKAPCGTLIRDKATNAVLRDLVTSGESIIIVKGGKGGKGNHKKAAATKGEPGEARDIILELKLIADVGIIGYPNAGKSTFISRISKAKPKIASYPFTTKKPVLGMVKTYNKDIVIADIPGLIEGAHQGKGLGDKFLRHIERTKILLHMIDAAAIDGRDPLEDYKKLNNELSLYSKSLTQKPQIIAANKVDLPEAKENVEKLKKNLKNTVFAISASTGEGVKDLLARIAEKL